jgi:hypothetical protein
MNRKAFRCGVLALLLTTALALPAISATSAVSAKRGFHSPRPAAPRGFLERAWRIWTGLHPLSGANRGGIDPNGQPAVDPSAQALPPTGSGDNRGGIDPNG